MADEVAIGIDLGTTYSCVAVQIKGEVKIIPNDVGSNTTPSYVTMNEDGDFYVGEISKSLAHENPGRTIFDVKRLIGRSMFDTEIKGDMKMWPFQVTHENCAIKIEIDDETAFYPEEISARVLSFLKGTAEDFLGHPVSKAIITVPAHFSDAQIEATKEAGRIAGLEVLKIIPEATAAAIAYNHLATLQPGNDESKPKNCLIFDLGGGTFDVCVLIMDKGKIEIKAVDGHSHTGGEDFDNAMTNHCIKQFKAAHGIDLNEEKYSSNLVTRKKAVKAVRRLKAECEKQKVFLSCIKKADVSLHALYEGKDIHVPFDQAIFNELNEPKFQLCMEILERAIKYSKIPKEMISDIVLVGGSSRIPRIQQLLMETLGGKQLTRRIDPETAVAFGAALEASKAVISKETFGFVGDLTLLDNFFKYSSLMPRSSGSLPAQGMQVRVEKSGNDDKFKLEKQMSMIEGKELSKKSKKSFFTLPKSIKNPFNLVSKVKKEENRRKEELKKRQNAEKVAQEFADNLQSIFESAAEAAAGPESNEIVYI